MLEFDARCSSTPTKTSLWGKFIRQVYKVCQVYQVYKVCKERRKNPAASFSFPFGNNSLGEGWDGVGSVCQVYKVYKVYKVRQVY